MSPLMRTTYSVGADGRVLITKEFPREDRTEERQLSAQQIEIFFRQANDAHLYNFAEKAEDLRERCRFRATDQPFSQIEFQWNGQRAEIRDDFDPQICSEVRDLRNFINSLPRLLNGKIIKTETKKMKWPRE